MMRALLLLATSLFLSANTLDAQSDNYLEVGVRLGIMNYQGDLQRALFTPAGSQPAFGAMLRYSIGENYAIRGFVEAGSLAASDADNVDLMDRGFSFEGSLLTGEVAFEYLPLGKERSSNGVFISQINPYLFAGFGAANIDAEVSTVDPADQSKFPEADDQSVFFTVPFGAGVRYDIVSGIAIGLEANWRATFNDYIDGVSVNGRSDREDWFWSFGGYASFTFGKNRDDSMNFR